MKESYYKDGQLFEKFTTYHHKKEKVRNRTEKFMINEIITTCEKPINCTIETLRTAIISVMDDYIKNNPSHGTCSISDLRIFSTIMGHPNWNTRSFQLIGRGRLTSTVCIWETIEKDTDNNWTVIDETLLPYNKIQIL